MGNLKTDLELCESVKNKRYIVDVFVDDGLYDWRIGRVKEPTRTKKDTIIEKYVYKAIQKWPQTILRVIFAEKEVKRLQTQMHEDCVSKEEVKRTIDLVKEDAIKEINLLCIKNEKLQKENEQLKEKLKELERLKK